jgi:hypothetical protein
MSRLSKIVLIAYVIVGIVGFVALDNGPVIGKHVSYQRTASSGWRKVVIPQHANGWRNLGILGGYLLFGVVLFGLCEARDERHRK